ncbi:dTDP-glucose 4,6-dehydratase [Halosimplex rubrum]|uniref:dTDP-glucose 4,6-dehydratase n=1 Tax=Halosimplex rubrum TaxID=869889 RepID=A0A7D5SQ31_9EURY|nr:dTDP-glucose 4,6-dehydratase [Halosimplex rubrum]QLH77287.1 dTDP-glucose 4,6-dehydratase [Halosimplex rubrum]
MRTLVTGGAGFIGSNYVRHRLARTGDEVVTLDALTYAGSADNLAGVRDHDRHEFVEGDVRDEGLVTDLVADADAVVHFAAESHVDRSIDGAAPFVSTNVDGTRALLDAARATDLDRFLQVSTDEVYGETVDGRFAETDPLDPRNPYAATKAGADHLALSYRATHGVPVVVTRSSNVFGPRQHPEKLIPKFLTRAARGEPLPLYGDGSNVREWTYVTDNCRALDRALADGEPGEVYNVASGEERTNLEVTEAVLDAVGASRDLIEFVDDRPGHDQRYALETGKIRGLGWEPEYDFEAGLERTTEFYLDE